MGTKRPFEEDLQELIKHPKHLENGNKSDLFGEDVHSLETSENVEIADGANLVPTGDSLKCEEIIAVPEMVETGASSPLVTGISGREEGAAPGLAFCPNLFPEFFEFNMPRRQLVHYDDKYASLLNNLPKKQVPIGPDYQADVPEFDPEAAKSYNVGYAKISDNGSKGICVIPISGSSFSNKDCEIENALIECKCLDGESIRCVRQHVNEARLKLKESLGVEKFADLGLNDMGEEVASKWTEQEEQFFQDVVYSNPVSMGQRFWNELALAFPLKTKRQLVSYYFNVFMLRRRAVQNRSRLLAIDSDDDEWWGNRRGFSGVRVENGDFVVVSPSSSEDSEDDNGGCEAEPEGVDVVIGLEDGPIASIEDHDSAPNMNQSVESSSTIVHDDEKVITESEQEQPLDLNKQEANNGGLRSESCLHWDPPYSTMGSTKGVDLLPTCSMIEEIFGGTGSSKTGNST